MAKLLSGTTVYGTATVQSQLFVSGTTAATSTTTGALQVIGGVGIGGAFAIGGGIYDNGNQIGTSTYVLASTGAGVRWQAPGTGPQGAQGATGSQGVHGAQGATGSQGVQGAQGATGTGAQGAQGVQGFQGVQGAQGATGPSTAINATANTNATEYIVGVAAAGSNQTPTVATTYPFSFNAASGVVAISTTTATGSTTTGALVVTGGVGIGGGLYVGGIVTATSFVGAFSGSITTATNATNVTVSTTTTNASYYLVFVSSSSGSLSVVSDAGNKLTYNPSTSVLSVLGTASSISTTTGAVVIGGGLGVGGNINVGGNVSGVGSITTITSGVYSWVFDNTGNLTLPTTGIANISAGTSTIYVNTGSAIVINNTATSTSITTGAVVIGGGLGVKGNINLSGNIQGVGAITTITSGVYSWVFDNTGNLTLPTTGIANISAGTSTIYVNTSSAVVINNTSTAVSTITGALRVVGGVGIGGALYVGGTINGIVAPLTSSTASASALTPTTTYNQYNFTALAANLTINAPTGSYTDGQKILFRILDNGTSRTLTWTATYTVIGVTLPTATTISKTTYVGTIYNANNTRWDVIAVTTQA